MPPEIAGIVLAAGRSSRMGAPKAEALLEGQPLLTRALHSLGLATERRFVVVAPGAEEAARAAGATPDVIVVENPDPDRGMLSSIAVGLAAAGPVWIMVLPVDCPAVNPATPALLAGALHDRRPSAAVVPTAQGRDGHPVLLGPDLCRAVIEADRLGESTSLGALLEAHRDEVVRLAVGDPAVLDNVNTPEDLDALRSRRRRMGPK
jgi:molybdenum cofactor cytidylyltransferase